MNKKNIWLSAAFLFALAALIVPAVAQSEYYYPAEISGSSFLPAEIHAGDTFSIAVDIKNKGTSESIVDLNGVIDFGYQFKAVEATGNTPVILPGSTKTIVFRLNVQSDTLPGYYPVFLTLNYSRGGDSVKQSQTIFVPVSRTEKNLDVTVEPRVINPGNQTELFFTLKNVGGTPVSNISFSWEEANDLVLPVGSDNKRYTNILAAGAEQKLSYIVAADPNITPGIYPLNVKIDFTDVNGTRTQESEVGIIIGGETDFEVSAETLSTGQLSLSIANVGSNNAGAVVVRIPVQEGISIAGSNTSILGNLNKGDFTLANFEMQQFDQNASGFGGQRFRQDAQPLQGNPQSQQGTGFSQRPATKLVIQIDYTDTTGQRNTVEKTIQLNRSVSGANSTALQGQFRQNGFLSILPWALLVLIALGAVAFNRFKAGNTRWKKLAAFLGAIAVVFLVAVFFFGSNLLAVGAAMIVSLGVLVWFFKKAR